MSIKNDISKNNTSDSLFYNHDNKNTTECLIEEFKKLIHLDIYNLFFLNLNMYKKSDIENNLLKKKKGDFGSFVKSLQVYNIKCLPKIMDTEFNIFYDFCQYDYFYIVSLLLKNTHIDLNARRILTSNFV